MQLAEMYVQQALRLVVWHHAGHLVKKLELAVDGQPLPKPYLGTPLSDGAAAFLAVSNGPMPAGTVSIVFKDQSGAPVFRSDEVPVRPLAEARDALDSADAYDDLLVRILRHAPKKLPGWTDQLSEALADLRRTGGPSGNAEQDVAAASGGAVSAVSSLRGAVDFIDGRRVAGWAVDLAAPGKALRLQLEVDGIPAGVAVANEVRQDLDPAGTELHHGFHALLRKEALASPGRELHRLSVRDLDSGRIFIDGHPLRYRPGQDEREIGSVVRRIDRLEQTLLELREQLPHLRRRAAYSLDDYDLWFRDIHEPALRYEHPADGPRQAPARPKIGVVVPLTADCTMAQFERILESLAAQARTGHQYLVVNCSQDDDAHKQLARSYVKRLPELGWIDLREYSARTILKVVLRHAQMGYLFLLRPGEALGRDAMDWVTRALAEAPARVLYADSDQIDADGAHRDPELRPDFNLDLLLSTPYIGAFCIERGLLESVTGEIADAPDGVWQYDLLLRAAERSDPSDWLHVAGVLTHRLASSTAAPDESGLRSALSVLRAHLARAQLPAQASIDDTLYRNNPRIPRSPHSFAARLRWQAPEPAPRVSIIVPTRDAADLLRTCIDSILERTRYPGHEILIVDHQSTAPEARRYLDTLSAQPNVSVIPYTGAFNWSAMNNLAVSRAKGEVLCFLNNDTEILSPDWLSELVGHAMRPEVGAVGAKLVLRDGTLQHGGVVLGVHGVAEHAFSGLPADEAGYMMRAGLTQNLSAVTGACLVCRREVFDAVGGFEMAHLGVAFNDVDFCLRLAQSGYRVVWTPHVRICHEGSTTRGRDWAGEQRSRLDQEMAYMRERWGAQLARDPHYHPAFERYEPPYAALTGAYRPPLARQ